MLYFVSRVHSSFSLNEIILICDNGALDWGLVEVLGLSEPRAPLSQIKIISYKEKEEWTLETKYNIGKKRED